jgi:hypothetical protein
MPPTTLTAATRRHAVLPMLGLGTFGLLLASGGTVGAQAVPFAAAPPDSVDRVAHAGPDAPWALPSGVPRAGAGIDSSTRRRPPRDNRIIASQVLAGGLTGFGGVVAMTIPYALSGLGGRKVNETSFVIAAGAAYVMGTVAGVHRAGKHHGLRGSVKGTLIGAAVGLLGGPAVLVTFPLGATMGYQRTRAYRESPNAPDGPLDAPGGPAVPARRGG